MNKFTFNATGRIDEIGNLLVNSKTGFTKRTFTITAGKRKSMHLDLHYRDTKQLDGLNRGDLVFVEFVIQGRSLKSGTKINNLIAQKVTKL